MKENKADGLKKLEEIEVKLSTLIKENKEDILNFLKYLLAKGVSNSRILKCAYTLRPIAEMLNKPFREASKQDIVEVVAKIEANKSYAERTKVDFKKILKQFYKWLKGNDEEFPTEVKWIKIRYKENRKLPEEILTKDEIERLASCAYNQRDKAFILTLFESGCRIGEFLPIKIKNLQFDDYGIVLIVNGKTGSRRVRIIEYAQELTNWLDIHPLKKDPEAFIWLSLQSKNSNKKISYNTVNNLLKSLAKKAGINKPVNPHAFRHARATYLAKELTEQQLKVYFGWSGSSRMAATYVHLSGKDIDEALLRIHGVKPKENNEPRNFSIKVCPKCKENNTILSHFCKKCGFPLDMKRIVEFDEIRRKLDGFMFEMLKRIAEKYPSIKKEFNQLVKEKGLESLFKAE